MCSCIVLQVNKWNWINYGIVLTYLTVGKKLHVARRRQAILSGIILDMGSFNERRRYIVTSSLIGWVHTGNDPCVHFDLSPKRMLRTQASGRVYSTQNYTWKYYTRSTLQNNTSMLDKYGPGIIKNADMHVRRPLLRSQLTAYVEATLNVEGYSVAWWTYVNKLKNQLQDTVTGDNTLLTRPRPGEK